MRFMLDENVPASVFAMLESNGHEVQFIRDLIPPGSPDQLVATVSERLEAILVSFDGDFQKIAPRVPEGARRRFRSLSRIWMRCREPRAAERLSSALTLIGLEYQLVQQGMMVACISGWRKATSRHIADPFSGHNPWPDEGKRIESDEAHLV